MKNSVHEQIMNNFESTSMRPSESFKNVNVVNNFHLEHLSPLPCKRQLGM